MADFFPSAPRHRIAIIGAGWLGGYLAGCLADSHAVAATYRKAEVRDRLQSCGVAPVYLDLPGSTDALPALFDRCDAAVVTLPPGGRAHGDQTTARYLGLLAPLAPFLHRVHLVYTSSTGVYGRAATGTVTEAAPLRPDTPSSEAVVAAEEFFTRHAPTCTILRLAGLYGPGRDPVRFFARQPAIPDADAPVNMIRREDAAEAIRFALTSGITGIFNACSATHPSKRVFYGRRYEDAGLAPKPFLPGGSGGKRIDSSKLRQLGWPGP